MHTHWRSYIGRDGWRWRVARALSSRAQRVARIRGVLVSGCAGYRVRPCADTALRGIERDAPTPEEFAAARIWLSEIKFSQDLLGAWRRGTFSSASLVRLAQRTGLETRHEEAIRMIDRETRAPGKALFELSPRHEQVGLITDAAHVWEKALPVLRTFWPEEAGRARWCVTGGAVLGARFEAHRQSADIDVQILPRQSGQTNPGLIEMDTGWLPWRRKTRRLDASMRAIGAWRELAERGHRSYWFLLPHRKDLAQSEAAKLDLFERKDAPRWPFVVTTIGANTVWSASTTQILHGKLTGRGHSALARDLFDVAVARHTDPDALIECLAHITPSDVNALAHRWQAMRTEIATDATRSLTGVAKRWEAVARDPARHAIEALRWAAFEPRSGHASTRG